MLACSLFTCPPTPGCFMLLNTGRELVQSRHGLLSTLAFRVGGRLNSSC